MVVKMIEIGKIVNTHALRGEVKIQPWCDEAEMYFDLDGLNVNDKYYKIEKTRIHKNFVIVKLEGIDSIEQAEQLKNNVVEVERDALGELSEGVYYICDLLDCRVETTNGILLGYIDDVIKTGSNDVYVLKDTKSRKPILIPVLPETVKCVDIENKRVTVELLKGLVDENEI